MRPALRRVAAFGLLLTLATGPAAEALDDPVSRFDSTVAPVLANRCLECHGSVEPKGNLDLTRRESALAGGENGPALVPGQPGESLLWTRIEDGEMPPKHPLAPDEARVLREWIAAGAPWGTGPIDPFRFTTARRAGYDWWALQPVRRPEVPPVADATWPRGPIDRFILARLEANGLQPSPEADRRTLVRRVTFDLIGLPPSPEEVEAFVSDPAADAYERLVDRLLASPHHGERWARHWLDVVRYGESHGFEHDQIRPNAWPYRDWVVRALNEDMPYDTFARLQIAGDLIDPEDPGAIAATGFLVAGPYDSVGQSQQSAAMRAVVRQDELEDIVGTVGQAFLGLTVQCARCHDHKFDPIRQDEYYKLTSALGAVRHGERDITPAAVREAYERRVAAAKAKLAAIETELTAFEVPIRQRIRAERQGRPDARPLGPLPLIEWRFAGRPDDGSAGITLHGQAVRTPEGLVVDGRTGFATTPPLQTALEARTLEVVVKLSTLDQGGGGAISVQTLDGGIFDAVVFGEQEPRRWMAGSQGFERTRSFNGPDEHEAVDRPVHLAIVHEADGTIRAYRDGHTYGTSYRTNPPVRLEPGRYQVAFGLRHAPAGGNRMLAGTILKAALHDRALDPDEVAARAGIASDYVGGEEILAALSPVERAEHDRLRAERAAASEAAAEKLAATTTYAVSPRPAEPARLLLRGEPSRPGPVVVPGAVAAVRGVESDFGLSPDASDDRARTSLARWITDPRNPLFARVIVNRLWQHHFGVGIVDTPNDFGFNGGRPSHPELIDWMAHELAESGWRLKAIHRAIVLSAAYRQSSAPRAEAAAVDADSRLLWRKPPRRLEAEAIQDAMLAVSGTLDPTVGGPGYRDFRHQVRGATHFYEVYDAPEFRRRSLYRSWPRGGRNRFLDAFDCPDPATTAPKRASTTTPLQALSLLNNAFALRMADQMAGRLRTEVGDEPAAQVDRAYRLALGRPAEADEIALAVEVVRRYELAAFTRALLNSNEFLHVD